MTDYRLRTKCRPRASDIAAGTVLVMAFLPGCNLAASNTSIVNPHRSSVRSIALSPDNKLLATASMDEAVQLWDVTTRKKTAEFPGMLSVDFSPDGKFVVAGCGTNQNVVVWDVANNRRHVEFPHSDGVNSLMCVKFLPDSRHVACGYGNGWVRIWDLGSGMETMHTQLSKDYISALAVSHDGKLLAIGGGFGFIGIFELQRGEIVTALWKAHSRDVHTLAFSSDDAQLVSSGHDIRFWSVPNGKPLRGFETGKIVRTFARTADETMLATGGGVSVRLWRWGASPQQLFEHKMRSVETMVFSSDGNLLIVGGSGRGNVSEILFLDVPQ